MKPKELKNFKKFLEDCGAEVLETTSQWEVLRIRADFKTLILYRNNQGNYSWPKQLKGYHRAFKNKDHVDIAGKNKIKTNLRPQITTLIKRDGDTCFFCQQPLAGDISIEHLVPRNIGGPNHIGNLALAHVKCNQDAGHITLMEKIKIRESNRPLITELADTLQLMLDCEFGSGPDNVSENYVNQLIKKARGETS